MAVTQRWGIYSDDNSALALGNTQDALQAQSVEVALNRAVEEFGFTRSRELSSSFTCDDATSGANPHVNGTGTGFPGEAPGVLISYPVGRNGVYQEAHSLRGGSWSRVKRQGVWGSWVKANDPLVLGGYVANLDTLSERRAIIPNRAVARSLGAPVELGGVIETEVIDSNSAVQVFEPLEGGAWKRSKVDGSWGEWAGAVGSSGGSISHDEIVSALGFMIHVGNSAPESPTGPGGARVIWLDTRDPGRWVPAAPVIDDVAKEVVIPVDDGAEYILNGEVRAPGRYPYYPQGEPIAITITAKSREGYTLDGVTRWSGYITAGWRNLGVDALTSGSLTPDRSPFGSPYTNISGAGTISADGLSNSTHGSRTTLTQILQRRGIGMKLSIWYDISNSVSSSLPSVTLGIGYKSVWYNDTSFFSVGLSLTREGKVAMGNGAPSASRDPYTLTPLDVNIPKSGTLSVEAVGTDVKVYVDDVLIGTGSAPGAVNALMANLSIGNNLSIVRNFSIGVQ